MRLLIVAVAPSLPGHLKLVFGDVDGDDLRAKTSADHDGGEADAAAAMNRQPFAALQASLIGHGTEGGGETAAEAGGGGVAHRLRQVHEVLVGIIDRDIFGEGTPMGEAGLELRFADLLVAGTAFMAMAAAGDERNGNAVAGLEAGDVSADCGDDAGKFMTGDVRQANIRVMPHPAVPIAPA